MSRASNATRLAELTDRFRNSDAVLLTEYRGLSVAQLKELRDALGADNHYTVAKNTLVTLAAREVGQDFLTEDLNGPTAVAFVSGEPVAAAKALRDFSRENPALVLKSGSLNGKQLTAAQVEELASLESRDQLLAHLAAALKAGLVKAAQVFDALPLKAVRTVDALREKQGGEAQAA